MLARPCAAAIADKSRGAGRACSRQSREAVGHFPHVERIARERGGILTVLERGCTDAPAAHGPACECLVPERGPCS